jgi:two-component system, chemotaxis family, response regulator Rcp1
MSQRKGASKPKQVEILVVESNPADTMLTVAAFKAAGLTSGLRCVTEGEDALSYVRREGQYVDVPIPDLIFLDLSNPRISGLEVLRVLKATPELRHIPIVVAAGSDDPKFIRAVYHLNGNCFIRKPNELTQFLRFVETCFEFWGNVVTLSPKPGARLPGSVRRRKGSGIAALSSTLAAAPVPDGESPAEALTKST